MKLLAYKDGILGVKAYLISRNGKNHFNIKHGTRLARGWEMTLGVDDKIAISELSSSDPHLELPDDDYILLPIMSKCKTSQILDFRGNKKFFISKNHSCDTGNALLLLSLPPVNDVSYEIIGLANEIGQGVDITHQGDSVLETLAPLIMLEGDSIITIKYTETIGDEDSTVVIRLEYKNNELKEHKERI